MNPVTSLVKKTRGVKPSSNGGGSSTGGAEGCDDHDALSSETLLLQLLHVLIDTYGMVHTECDLTPSSPEQRIVQVTHQDNPFILPPDQPIYITPIPIHLYYPQTNPFILPPD